MTKPTGKPRGRPKKAPMETLQVLPSPPPDAPTPDRPRYFTPKSLRDYDFTGWDWRQLPYGCVKAARNGAVQGNKIHSSLECVECKRPMWTCDPKRENLCEECDYFLRSRNWDMKAQRAKRNNLKPVNPFGETDTRSNRVNPFRDLR